MSKTFYTNFNLCIASYFQKSVLFQKEEKYTPDNYTHNKIVKIMAIFFFFLCYYLSRYNEIIFFKKVHFFENTGKEEKGYI